MSWKKFLVELEKIKPITYRIVTLFKFLCETDDEVYLRYVKSALKRDFAEQIINKEISGMFKKKIKVLGENDEMPRL